MEKSSVNNPFLTYLICILYIFIFTLNLSFGQPLFGEDRLDILIIESSLLRGNLIESIICVFIIIQVLYNEKCNRRESPSAEEKTG